MDSISVRAAVSSDAEGIATVHVLTWQSAYKGLMPESYLSGLSIAERTERWVKQLEQPGDGSQHFVAEIAAQIVGFATVGRNSDGSLSDHGELYAIYVLAKLNGAGIGTKLLDRGKAALIESGFNSATLWVLQENLQARKWYETRGWRPDGRSKVEHREGFDLREIGYSLALEG